MKGTESFSSELIEAAGKLKAIKRSGWIKKAGIARDCESVADHSFRMSLLGLYFGIELDLDSSKIVRMCLIHDLAESQIGDKMPEEKSSEADHRIEEDQVMRKILGSLPEKIQSVLISDWQELFKSKTKEAKLVWQMDKLEMYFQSQDYEKMGYDKKYLLQFQKIEVTDPSLKSGLRLYPLTI